MTKEVAERLKDLCNTIDDISFDIGPDSEFTQEEEYAMNELLRSADEFLRLIHSLQYNN